MHDTIPGLPDGRSKCSLAQTAFAAIQKWFDAYTSQFRLPDAKYQHFITLKIEHTHHVRREIRELAESVKLDTGAKRVAEAVALLHDVGRFAQYRRYRTFSDLGSEDHGELGKRTILEHGVLSAIDEHTRNLILHAVSSHNKMRPIPHPQPEFRLFASLLRDADKLDILRIVAAHYENRDAAEEGDLGLGLSGAPEISAAVLQSFLSGRMVRLEQVTTLDDLKILQIGWIYDLNFPLTLRKIEQRNYLDRILQTLPQTEATAQICRKLAELLAEGTPSTD